VASVYGTPPFVHRGLGKIVPELSAIPGKLMTISKNNTINAATITHAKSRSDKDAAR